MSLSARPTGDRRCVPQSRSGRCPARSAAASAQKRHLERRCRLRSRPGPAQCGGGADTGRGPRNATARPTDTLADRWLRPARPHVRPRRGGRVSAQTRNRWVARQRARAQPNVVDAVAIVLGRNARDLASQAPPRSITIPRFALPRLPQIATRQSCCPTASAILSHGEDDRAVGRNGTGH